MQGRAAGTAYQQLMGTTPAADEKEANLLAELWAGGTAALVNAGTKLAMSRLESNLKAAAMDVAMVELRGHLDYLIGQPAALKAESVQLPSPQGLTPQQMQRAVTLAALVVAARVSGKMLQQAKADLGGLEQEYQELITRRERAATLLQQALATPLPASARGVFAEAELRELRAMLASRTLAEFVNDLGAQNMALRWVAATDPRSFADYKARSEGLTRRQAAAVRAASGTVAFGAMLAQFGREVVRMAKGESLPELLALGPLALTFATETPPVLEATLAVVGEGVSSLTKRTGAFRVVSNGKTEEVESAAAVYRLLERQGALDEWRQALFRDAGRGIVQSVYGCDAKTTAQMLDAAVPRDLRGRLAKELQVADADEFSFVASLDAPGSRELMNELLSRDHRPRLAERRASLAAAQWAVAGREPVDGEGRPGYQQWNNDQLLRLVFVNRDGNAAQFASMEMGPVAIRPVPSMHSLFAYEQLADACRARFSPASVRPRS